MDAYPVPTKIPGAHKIGAAICGPRIVGKKFTDTRLFLFFFIPREGGEHNRSEGLVGFRKRFAGDL